MPCPRPWAAKRRVPVLLSLATWLQALSPEFGFFRVFQYRVITIRQGINEVVDANRFSSSNDLFICDIRLIVNQVFFYCALKQPRVLQDH